MSERVDGSALKHPLFIPVFVGTIAYIAKGFISLIIELRDRKHMLRGLYAYINMAVCDLEENNVVDINGRLDYSSALATFRSKIDSDSSYTPYPTFDDSISLSLLDLKSDYHYLDAQSYASVVNLINAERYAIGVMKSITEGIVMNLEPARKMSVIEEMLDARTEWHHRAKIATDHLMLIKEMNSLDWIMNFMIVPKLGSRIIGL